MDGGSDLIMLRVGVPDGMPEILKDKAVWRILFKTTIASFVKIRFVPKQESGAHRRAVRASVKSGCVSLESKEGSIESGSWFASCLVGYRGDRIILWLRAE